MAVIGLYDIDMWHRGRSGPNLELMKTYNYYNNKGHKVIMMRPEEDEGRYNKIIYFKENPRIQLPKKLIVNGDKKEIYGFGFYNKFFPLNQKIISCPPDFSPYDLWSYKLYTFGMSYNNFKNCSLVRFENEDFCKYNKNVLPLIFVDYNFLDLPDADKCLQKYKNHRFYFYHTLWAKDEATYYKFEPYLSLINDYIIIDFKYSEDFFFDNFKNEKIVFKFEKRENETILNYQLRNVKMGLIYKNSNIRFKLPFHPIIYNDLDEKIINWMKDKTNESFEKMYGSKDIINLPSEMRLLLKQNPLTVDTSQIDFYKNL